MAKYKLKDGSLVDITLEEVKRLVNKPEWDAEVWDTFFEFVESECDAVSDYIEVDDIPQMADSVVILNKDDILRVQQEHGTVPDHELDDDELVDSVDVGEYIRWIAPISQRSRIFQVLQYYLPSDEIRDRRPSIIFKLDSWDDPDAGTYMTVGILVPGVAFWEELWNEHTGLEQTTLENTPYCMFTKGVSAKVGDTFWKVLSKGDVIAAIYPDYRVLPNVAQSMDKPLNSVIYLSSLRFPEIFPEGWIVKTEWHDEWIPVDRNLLFEFQSNKNGKVQN